MDMAREGTVIGKNLQKRKFHAKFRRFSRSRVPSGLFGNHVLVVGGTESRGSEGSPRIHRLVHNFEEGLKQRIFSVPEKIRFFSGVSGFLGKAYPVYMGELIQGGEYAKGKKREVLFRIRGYASQDVQKFHGNFPGLMEMGMVEKSPQPFPVGPAIILSGHPPGIEAKPSHHGFFPAVEKIHNRGVSGKGEAEKIIQGILRNQTEIVEFQILPVELPPAHHVEIPFGCQVFRHHRHGFRFIHRKGLQGKPSPLQKKLQKGKLFAAQHGFRKIRSGCIPVKEQNVPSPEVRMPRKLFQGSLKAQISQVFIPCFGNFDFEKRFPEGSGRGKKEAPEEDYRKNGKKREMENGKRRKIFRFRPFRKGMLSLVGLR